MIPEIITSIPGPRSLALAARLREHESRNVTYMDHSWPVFWEKAKGVNVWDADGNRFLDFTSAFGVAGFLTLASGAANAYSMSRSSTGTSRFKRSVVAGLGA